jgi:hypothetical protein
MTGADFGAILERLASHEVDFIVIGGLAASLHGSAYVTQDVDICYGRSESSIERLCRSLTGLHPALRGAPEGLPFRFDPQTVKAGLSFTLSTDLGPLDLLGEVSPFGGFDLLKPHAVEMILVGHAVLVLSLPALIQTKRAAGRPKDLLVVPELEALLELSKKG